MELKGVDGFTLIDYIKSSIEVLMNMKMEETQDKPDIESNTKINQRYNKQRYKDIEEPEIDITLPSGARAGLKDASRMDTQLMVEILKNNNREEDVDIVNTTHISPTKKNQMVIVENHND